MKKNDFLYNKRAYLSVFLVACTLISSLGLPLAVFADNVTAEARTTSEFVYENIDHRKLSAITDYSVDDFNSGDVLWTVTNSDGSTPTAKTVSSLDIPPYTALEGDRCLEVSSNANHYKWSHTELSYSRGRSNAADFSAARYFFFAIAAGGADGTPYEATLTLKNYSGATVVRRAQLYSGGWNAVVFPIDEQSSKLLENVTDVTLRVSRTSDHTDPIVFAVDQMGFSASSSTLTALNFLSHGYSFLDRHLYGSESLVIDEFNAENPQLIASGLRYTDFSEAGAIQLRFVNNTNCRSVTFMYTTPDSPYYSEEHSVTVSIGGSKEQTCAFAVPEDTVTGFKFVFNGKISGDLEIYSISAVPYYIPENMPVSIKDCLIDESGLNIVLSGEFDEESSRARSSEKLYLYALDMSDDDSSVLSNRVYPVAETSLHQNEFTFTWKDGVSQNGIYKKYLVTAIMDGEEKVVSGHAYVTNPQAISSIKGDSTTADSKKGMVWDGASLETKGSGYVNININCAELLTLDSTDHEYIFNGKTYNFSRELISSLDEAIRSFGEDRAKVYFTLTVSSDSLDDEAGGSVGGVLIHPSSESGAKYSAFNTATPEGINAFAAVCEFLASRYAEDEDSGLFGIILGENIEDSKTNYNLGPVGLNKMAEEYSSALRIAYSAFRSHNASVRVCISLGCDWNMGYPADARYVFDSRMTLDVLSEIIRHGGDIDWSLAFDPMPAEGDFAANPHLENSSEVSEKRITVSNAEQLIDYMKHEKLYYNGAYRKLLLIEHRSIDDEGPEAALANAADYVYSYYRISSQNFSYIDAYISNRRLLYGDVYKYIDTNLSREHTSFALEYFQLEDWRTIIPIFDYSGVFERYVEETAFTSAIPQGIVGSAELFDFSEAGGDWYVSDGQGTIVTGGDLGDRKGVMNTVFYSHDSDKYRGISINLPYRYDLTSAPHLRFDAQIAVLPEGVNEVELCVTAYSGLSYINATGVIRSGIWNPVVIDLENFEGSSGIDGIRIRLKGIDGADIGEPTLIIDGISVMSQSLSSDDLSRLLEDMERGDDTGSSSMREYVFYGAVVVFGLALIIELAYIAARSGGRKER